MDREYLERLYNEDKSLKTIGKITGKSTATIFRLFKKLQIKTDPKRRNHKIGNKIFRNGYVFVKAPNHPRANYGGYVREHILVMESELGRGLNEGERVHHKDENKINNYPTNLDHSSDLEHKSYHAKKAPRGRNGRFMKILR